MAETLISPGVLAREQDTSFINKRPVQAGAAIIGPTAKGPVEVPTIVTTYDQFTSLFGTTIMSGSSNDQRTYTYFTSIAAQSYFAAGGTSLLVCRVVTGSYSSATSSYIPTGSGGPTTGASPFVLQTFSKGIIMNSSGSESTNNTLVSGSKDNLRWEIANVNTSSGKFDLIIRRGNDTSLNKDVLESFGGVNLDPNSPDYIARRVGDINENYDSNNNQIAYSGSFANQSDYIRISAVNFTTPNYLDSNGTAKDQYTGSFPINCSGAFGGALGDVRGGANFYHNISNTDSQGLTGGCYDNMIRLLANQDDYKFNMLLTPGLIDGFGNHASQITNIISNIQNRGDSIYVVDPVAYGSTVTNAVARAATKNTSYAAMYWPWLRVNDPSTGENVWTPASTLIGGVYANNDKVAYPWFAPAGINRGGLGTGVLPEQRLSQTQRDTLYNGKVNPIASFPSQGVVVYGQKTLQTKASALDRVNVRRLLIAVKSYISQIANTLVFEQNTAATRNNFLAQVNPYLSSVQQRQGLYAFKVIMDDSNNTPDVIDRNELVGQIYLQPTKTAEFIYLDFNITPTGASFPA